MTGRSSPDLTEIHRSVGRIEGKLDTFINQMAEHDKRTTELEVRTRKVENRQHWYAGAGAVVGGLVAWLGNHLRLPIT